MKETHRVWSILLRYLLLVLIALPNLSLFYFIFTPITVYFVYFLLNLFFDSSLSGNVITVGHLSIEIINACVAGSAYYLLTVLCLSVPKLNWIKRTKIILFSLATFFSINILRIFLLSLMEIYENIFFDIAHKLSWYFGSIVLVVGIWFFEVKLFKIKETPVYSDIKYLLKIKNMKKSKSSEKNKNSCN